MAALVIGAGILVQVAAWRLIAGGRVDFWPTTSITFVLLAVAAVLVREPGSLDAPALALGVGSGVVLYVATWIALGVLVRAAPFAASTTAVYGRAGELSTALVWVLTLVVAVPGEELFWRGLVLPELQDATTVLVGASLAWIGYVAVMAVSRNLAILAAAVVCGGCWTILGSVDDVAAPLASHLVWTSLMLAWPPTGDRAKVET